MIAAALIIPAMVAIAYGAVFGPEAGIVVAVLGLIVIAVVVWRISPRISVDEDGLHVDRATLPRSAIAGVDVIEDSHADEVLRDDMRYYTALRRGVPKVLRAQLRDTQDPHRGWLISVRNPEAFVLALDPK